MIDLRPYQNDAVTECAKALVKTKTSVIVAPTASGKSIICAEIVRRFLKKSPADRVLILCHQGHLLTQNEEKIHLLVPDSLTKTGMYCAAEKRKETMQQIILASRDSLGRAPDACGSFSLVIIDEAHLVDVNAGTDASDTFYSRIFKAIGSPYIVGLTGTPWRLSGGKVYGANKFFKSLAYEIKMAMLIEEGYLSPYTFPEGETKVIDTEGMQITSKGDFSTSDMEKITMPREVIVKCLDKWQQMAVGRRVSVFFCCSVAHAQMVEKELNLRLKSSEHILYIDGKVTGDKRKEYLENVKAGKYTAIVNIGVLTTGFDAPIIDCVVMLRPTASAALFVQSIGRGLRTYGDKKDCLILDMAGNFERFGSLEDPIVEDAETRRAKREEEKEEHKRRNPGECTVCQAKLIYGNPECPSCGYMPITHTDEVFSLAPKIYNVANVSIEPRTTRAGDKALLVIYHIAIGIYFSEWLLIGKKYFGQKKAIAKAAELSDPTRKVSRIKVTHNMKAPQFPSIEILAWEYCNNDGKCRHLNVERQNSDSGIAYVFCNDCEELI